MSIDRPFLRQSWLGPWLLFWRNRPNNLRFYSPPRCARRFLRVCGACGCVGVLAGLLSASPLSENKKIKHKKPRAKSKVMGKWAKVWQNHKTVIDWTGARSRPGVLAIGGGKYLAINFAGTSPCVLEILARPDVYVQLIGLGAPALSSLSVST